MKTCSTCKKEKPVDEFYRDKQRKDGRYPVCKSCKNASSVKFRKKYYEEYYNDPEKKRRQYELHEVYQSRPEFEAQRKRYQKGRTAKFAKRHPDRYQAMYTFNNAIRLGKIKRGNCEVCGEENAQGHHEDYSKPLEVIWLCRRHHMNLHKGTLIL